MSDSIEKVIAEMRRVESNPRESHVLAAVVGSWADRLRALANQVWDDDPNALVAELRAEIQRLHALSPAGGDWVMVPREPTPKMIDSTFNHFIETNGEAYYESHNTRNRRIYTAMIAAAPQQEPGAELTESEQASIDAAIYGTGVMVDGKRVAPEHVYIATPASFTEKELDKFVNALTATSAGTMTTTQRVDVARLSEIAHWLRRFSDDGQHKRIPGPSAGQAYEAGVEIEGIAAARRARGEGNG